MRVIQNPGPGKKKSFTVFLVVYKIKRLREATSSVLVLRVKNAAYEIAGVDNIQEQRCLDYNNK